MVGPLFLRLTCTLLSALCAGAEAQTGAIAGKATDPSGIFLPFPKIHVSGQGTAEPGYEANGDAQGRFRLEGIEPGVYTIEIILRGFHKTISGVRVSSGNETQLGAVLLDFAGCDSPGVMCDDFGLSVYNDPIHREGVIEIPQRCGFDIDEGKLICAIDGRVASSAERDHDADFWIRVGPREELFMVPLNGVQFALNPPAEWSKSGCISATYSAKEVRIDGLSLGSRICIHTSRERYAQTSFLDVIGSGSEKVKLSFITWQGKHDVPSLQITH